MAALQDVVVGEPEAAGVEDCSRRIRRSSARISLRSLASRSFRLGLLIASSTPARSFWPKSVRQMQPPHLIVSVAAHSAGAPARRFGAESDALAAGRFRRCWGVATELGMLAFSFFIISVLSARRTLA